MLLTILGTSWCHLEVIHSWKNVDFAFPNVETKYAMLRGGLFIPKNIAIIDVDYWEGSYNPLIYQLFKKIR